MNDATKRDASPNAFAQVPAGTPIEVVWSTTRPPAPAETALCQVNPAPHAAQGVPFDGHTFAVQIPSEVDIDGPCAVCGVLKSKHGTCPVFASHHYRPTIIATRTPPAAAELCNAETCESGCACPGDCLGAPRDPIDIIAGQLQTSRGHAIDLMREALRDCPPPETDDTTTNDVLADALERLGRGITTEAAARLRYLDGVDGQLTQAQNEIVQLRDTLQETKRPMTDQMARQNVTIVKCNERIMWLFSYIGLLEREIVASGRAVPTPLTPDPALKST